MNQDRKHLVIMRGSSQYVNPTHYNVQEIGLGKALVKLGWNITVLTSGPQNQILNINDHLTWHELPRVGGGTLGWPQKGLYHLYNLQADIIQCQDVSNLSVYLSYKASRKKNVPLVLSLGEYKSKSKLKAGYAKVTANLIASSLSGVLCKTKDAMKYSNLLKLGPAHYAPVGIDPSAYQNEMQKETRQWHQSILEAKEKGFLVLTHIGRLDKEDNFLFLLSILRNLRKKAKLVIAGNPVSYADQLPEYKELKENVMLLGRVPNSQIGHLLKLSDLYLSCSYYEIFGMSAAESIYHGCPVLGYATGGIAEIVETEINGHLLNERESEVWANQIEHLADTDLLHNWRRGCQLTREKLTWDYRAKTYHEVYTAITSQKGEGVI